MDLFNRQVVVNIEDMEFDLDNYWIEFEVQFTHDSDNISEITIYNISKSTINRVQIGDRIRIKAGYGDSAINIFQGIIDDLEIDYLDIDRTLKLYCIDNMETFNYKFIGREFVRRFRRGIKASELLETLVEEYGMAVQNIRLQKDREYTRGYIADGKLLDIIERICKDCDSELVVENGVIDIKPIRYIENAFISFERNTIVNLNKNSGLINSPQIIKEEMTDRDLDQEELEDLSDVRKMLKISKYKVNCLLNPNLKTDSRIYLESNTANGIYVVEEGKHICNEDFRTEVKVTPIEQTDEQVPLLI